jgi:L-gulono-1,4-lactone dehydrogenase
MILSRTHEPTEHLRFALMNSRLFTNFGGNQSFRPASVFTPRDESDLLDMLRACRGRRIRAIGRLHSWSEAPVAEEVLVDLRRFQGVRVEEREGRKWVTVGAGCQIKRILAELARQKAGTLPSLGLITEQSIAGAISTGTHGSGKSSMSHFVEEVRVAAYDPATGEPVIRTISGGDELRAARCSLGALGVIVSVGFWSRPRYNVEECFRRYGELESVLAMEEEFPLQQFFLMPWSWEYFAQHRRETESLRGGWATLYRLYFFLQFDIVLHLLVRFAVCVLRSPRLVRFLFQKVVPRVVVQNWNVVDDSSKMLVMEHELFQHIECEMFVCRSRLAEAVDLLVRLLKHFGGDREALDVTTRDSLQQIGMLEEIETLCGSYTHHYPICIRRVLPDDTLISMSSGSEEPYYAVSFISYARRTDREGFLAFAGVVSRVLGALFGARPHWGKVCPLTAVEAARLYPGLPRFREICAQADPSGVFRNDWIARTLFAK